MLDIIEKPTSLDAHSLAEWAEFVVLLDDQINDLSVTEIQADFPSGRKPLAEEVELALAIIERRAELAPLTYPLRRVGDRIVAAGHSESGVEAIDQCLYLFLKILCLEYAPWVRDDEAHTVGALFDYLVLEALLQESGDGTQGRIFGWPPRDGRPGPISEAIAWLAAEMGLPEGDLDHYPDSKDAGVDCILWKPFADGRTGIPVWLVQASVEHDVVRKASISIPVEAWKRWIRFCTGVLTVFAAAHSIPDGSNHWLQITDLVGVVIDRSRLAALLDQAGTVGSDSEWVRRICEFVDEQVANCPTPRKKSR